MLVSVSLAPYYTVMPRTTRLAPETLPTESLLPSQRALFEVKLPFQDSTNRLSLAAREKLAEFFSYEVQLLSDEAAKKWDWDEIDHAENRSRLQFTARSLSSGRYYAKSRIIDRSSGVDPYGEHQTDPPRFFTPEGFVEDPIGDFQQRLLLIEMAAPYMRSVSLFGLYTNNISAQPPRWEYVSRNEKAGGRFPTMDMLPNLYRSDPYFMHAVPDTIQSEELADSVVARAADIVQQFED